MKKNLILLLALCITSVAFAQVKVGLRGGALLSNVDYTLNSNTISTENVLNYQAGLMITSNVGKVIDVSTGFLFSAKGYEIDHILQSQTYQINYVDIPLMLGLKFGVKKLNLFVEGGTTLSVAVNGTLDDGVQKEDLKFGSDEDELKLFDYGATFGGGLQFGNLKIGLNYNLGLQDLKNTSKEELKNQNAILYAIIYLN